MSATGERPASVSIKMPERNQYRDSIKDLQEKHKQLFRAIAIHPEAGIFRRYGEERAACLYYIESQVERRIARVGEHLKEDELQKETHVGRDLSPEYGEAVMDLNEWLYIHGRSAEQYRTAALAPAPSQFFMDFFRRWLSQPEDTSSAPNGIDRDMYGSEGTPVPGDLQTLNKPNVDAIENLLAYRFMDPILNFVCHPFETTIACFGGGSKRSANADKTIRMRHISRVAKVLSCMLATVAIAIPASILDSEIDRKAKFSVMVLFGLAFSTLSSFVGPESMPTYNLITTFFQAMLIFVGASDQKQKNNF